MALRYAKQFRSRPFLLNFLDVCQTRNQIEFACHKEHAIRTAQWLIMGRRTEMKMPRYKRSLDVRPVELASYERRRGTLPNRVLDVHDRRHQRKETKIALDDREQRADPAAVAGPEDAELATTALAQRRHERVQHQYCRRAPAACAREKICASDVVRRKFGADRTAPSDRRAVADLTHESAITRNSVKIVRRKSFAFRHIALQFIAAARVQAMT